MKERIEFLEGVIQELLEALKSIENDDGSIPAAIWEMRNAAIKRAESV
jgi:hypothetical protein